MVSFEDLFEQIILDNSINFEFVDIKNIFIIKEWYDWIKKMILY
jgi:hypothetical protein